MNQQMQYLAILSMSLSGAVLGAVYDVYRTILSEWKYLRFLGPVLDFLFWVFALLLVLVALHEVNHGDVRVYVFVLLGIGLVLYRLLLRKLVVGSTVRIVLAITFSVKMIYRLFMMLVVTPLLWIGSLLLALWRLIDRLAAGLERLILWPFQPLLRVCSWLLHKLYRLAIEPLVGPVVRPVQKFVQRVKSRWKGFLRAVAKWLVGKDQDDDDNKKR
ncbi:spore cortex biosynthesis protein YabQ [Tumebacillus lipolyticus]|uniref:Spore cortex biosynthesis protein YabQ n=1 Tax=Tumebacillus lipolyticus TaxID=1280370 RepID=A0ABW4ZYP1_9BACL